MTISGRILCLIACATVCSMTILAEAPCPATPLEYRELEFGDARFAVEEGCRRTFTQNEQFFLAGVAQVLSSNCRLPRNRTARAVTEQLLEASTLALALRKADGPLREPQSDRAAAFAAGRSMMEDIRCNGPEAALLSRGIVMYLERTSRSSRFLAGCVEFYAGRHTEKQCRCIADTLRSVMRDVDGRFFDKELIRQSIHDSPTIAFPLMFSCGVTNY
jgi:hypothetical protein